MTVKPIKFGTGRQLADHAYVQTLADFFSAFDQVPRIQNKIKNVMNAFEQINQGYLPPKLVDIEITEADIDALQSNVLTRYPNNPEEGNAYWESMIARLENLDGILSYTRDILMSDFDMYNYANVEFVTALNDYIGKRSVLELMAGQGYITAGLRALNSERLTIATDNQSWLDQPGEHIDPVTEVLNEDAITALENHASNVDVILMSWAPDTDDIDWRVLSWIREHAPMVEFIIIGEKNGATNSERFWRETELTPLNELNKSLKSFDLIDEKVYIAR